MGKSDAALLFASLSLVVSLSIAIRGCDDVAVDDPPPVILPSERTVVVLYESSEQSVPLHALEARENVGDGVADFIVIDPDVISGDDETPATLVAAIEVGKQVGLPALVITTSDGVTVIKAIALPDTAAEIVALIE